MLFKDRKDAGIILAEALIKYKNDPNTIVLGLPRGGIVVAYEIAKKLHLPLDVICPRKIGAPYNPEFAIGAITETGEGFFDQNIIEQLDIPPEYIKEEVAKEKEEAKRRLSVYRKNKPPILSLENKKVIIVDDGIATGATMKAAIQSIKTKKPSKLVIAIPVAPKETLDEMEGTVDEIVCLATPPFFQAVGQFYHHFYQTTDQEVIDLLT